MSRWVREVVMPAAALAVVAAFLWADTPSAQTP